MSGHNQASMKSVTELLVEWRKGNAHALDQMIPLIYDELRRVARSRLAREAAGHGLQATALVHEAYARLIDARALPANSREHFIALASRLMRQILVDDARRRHALKRGTRVPDVDINSMDIAIDAPDVDILALDAALERLGILDARQRDIVEMKFFGGLTIAEIAAALDLSHATVEREWAMARAFLYSQLRP